MRILDKEYNNILFVHIPKTAGTSIFNIIDENKLDNWKRSYPRRHDPYFSLKQDNVIGTDTYSFSVVRNPYRRTYSCFVQYNKTNRSKISFIEYLTNIQNNKISQSTPMLHLPQSFYIFEGQNLQVTKIYKFENLQELEKDFNWNLSVSNTGNYMVELYCEDYTEKAIKITQELYGIDFANFDYSLNFDQSLEE